jgi:hypothetical protein
VLQEIGRQGWREDMLAKQLGVSVPWLIQRLGAIRSPLTGSELRSFAAVLGVDPAQFLDLPDWHVCTVCGCAGRRPTHRMSCPTRRLVAAP